MTSTQNNNKEANMLSVAEIEKGKPDWLAFLKKVNETLRWRVISTSYTGDSDGLIAQAVLGISLLSKLSATVNVYDKDPVELAAKEGTRIKPRMTDQKFWLVLGDDITTVYNLSSRSLLSMRRRLFDLARSE